ncbi:MAG: glycoside hydrolase family 25 protein [Ruminococcus sp.]|nr:glycoside hydrolase family 25 protein [Ruminococcus sp.]
MAKKRYRLKKLAVFEAFVSILLLGILAWVLAIGLGYLREDPEVQPTVSEITADIPDHTQVLTTAAATEEPTETKKYSDFHIEGLPENNFKSSNFVTRNGYSFYTEDGRVTSIAGIDISEFQGDIDWEEVKAAGIDFAIIRIGARAYGNGTIVMDNRYEENLLAADAAGVKTGVYFFSQATSEWEAIEEAEVVIDAIAPFNITYPVVFDWEIIDESARTDEVSPSELADYCIAFCERIRNAGYTPMIYQNKGTVFYNLDIPRVADYDFWLAEYASKPTYPYEFQMWQYTGEGTVPGIDTTVDLNICFKDYSKN